MRPHPAAAPHGKPDFSYMILFLSYFLYFMVASVFTPYFSAYYQNLGFSMVQIGTLTAIGSVCAVLVQPLWSSLADRLGNRLLVLRIVVAGSLATILLLVLPRSFFPLFLTVTLFQSFFTAIIPVQDAISLTYCNQRRKSYAGVRIGGPIGYALLVVFTGKLAGSTVEDMHRTFLVGAAGFLVLLILTRFMPRNDSGVVNRSLGSIGTLLRNRRLVLFLMYMFAYQLGLTFLFSFIALYIRGLGLSNSYIGYSMCIAASTEIPVLLVIDRVLKRVSPARLLLFSGLVLAVRLVLTAQADSFAGIALAQLFHGMCFMTAFYSGMQFINREVPAELKASGVGLLTLIQAGFAAILSSIGGGFLADLFSIRTVLRLDAGFMLLLTLAGTAAYLLRHRIPGLDPSRSPES